MNINPNVEKLLEDHPLDSQIRRVREIILATEDTVWLNDGTGSFTDSGQSSGTTYTASAELGDLDKDGGLDAFVTHGELGKSYDGGLPNEVWLNKIR